MGSGTLATLSRVDLPPRGHHCKGRLTPAVGLGYREQMTSKLDIAGTET